MDRESILKRTSSDIVELSREAERQFINYSSGLISDSQYDRHIDQLLDGRDSILLTSAFAILEGASEIAGMEGGHRLLHAARMVKNYLEKDGFLPSHIAERFLLENGFALNTRSNN